VKDFNDTSDFHKKIQDSQVSEVKRELIKQYLTPEKREKIIQEFIAQYPLSDIKPLSHLLEKDADNWDSLRDEKHTWSQIRDRLTKEERDRIIRRLNVRNTDRETDSNTQKKDATKNNGNEDEKRQNSDSAETSRFVPRNTGGFFIERSLSDQLTPEQEIQIRNQEVSPEAYPSLTEMALQSELRAILGESLHIEDIRRANSIVSIVAKSESGNRIAMIKSFVDESTVRRDLGIPHTIDDSDTLTRLFCSSDKDVLEGQLPLLLERYSDLILDGVITGDERIRVGVYAHGLQSEFAQDFCSWAESGTAFVADRLYRLHTLVEDDSLTGTTMASSARGWGNLELSGAIFEMIGASLAKIGVSSNLKWVMEMIQKGGSSDELVTRLKTALRLRGLAGFIEAARLEKSSVVTSPYFLETGSGIKSLASIMRTGRWTDSEETMYKWGAFRTDRRGNIKFGNSEYYDRRLSTIVELGIQEGLARIIEKQTNKIKGKGGSLFQPDLEKIMVFTMDGCYSPVVIGWRKARGSGGTGSGGPVVLSKGEGWGMSVLELVTGERYGYSKDGTDVYTNEWVSTIKVAVYIKDGQDWSVQTGCLKEDVMAEFAEYYLKRDISEIFQYMKDYDEKAAHKSPVRGLLMRMMGTSDASESRHRTRWRAEVSTQSIDTLFLASIIAGKDADLASPNKQTSQIDSLIRISGGDAVNTLFEFDNQCYNARTHELIDPIEDPYGFCWGILGSKLLQKVQGISTSKPLMDFYTEDLPFQYTGSMSSNERRMYKVLVAIKETISQTVDLSDNTRGPNALESQALAYTSLLLGKRFIQIRNARTENEFSISDSQLMDLAYQMAGVLKSFKIGEPVRYGHTAGEKEGGILGRLRKSLESSNPNLFRVEIASKIGLIDGYDGPERYSLKRTAENIHCVTGGTQRSTTYIEDLNKDGSIIRQMIEINGRAGFLVLPIEEIINSPEVNPYSGVMLNPEFFMRSRQELKELIGESAWVELSPLFEKLDYLCSYCFEDVNIEVERVSRRTVISPKWDFNVAKFGGSCDWTVDDALKEISKIWKQIFTIVEGIDGITLEECVDTIRFMQYSSELMLLTKSELTTDPLGSQISLHLDENGMPIKTTSSLAIVSAEHYIALMDTIGQYWMYKSILANIEEEKNTILLSCRPGSGGDDLLGFAYTGQDSNVDSNDTETFFRVEGKTYTYTYGTKKSIVHSRVVESLLTKMSDTPIDLRLIDDWDTKHSLIKMTDEETGSVYPLFLERISDVDEQTIKDFFMKSMKELDTFLARKDQVGLANMKSRREALQALYKDIFSVDMDSPGTRLVDWSSLRATQLDADPIRLSGQAILRNLDRDVLRRSLNDTTYRFLVVMGWLDS
jgi:hypothetical protein